MSGFLNRLDLVAGAGLAAGSSASSQDAKSDSVFTRRALRNKLGQFPTGVCIVTTRAPSGTSVGLTINSFASVSLEPPLVSWSLSDRSANLEVFRDSRYFAISVLANAQEAVARRFADASIGDKFEGVDTRQGFADVPLIAGAVATYVCEAYRAWPAGDHLLLVGQVVQIDGCDAEPLVFHQGRFVAMRPEQAT